METLRLFDDCLRQDQDVAAYGEPDWKYLNRTARPGFAYLRDTLESCCVIGLKPNYLQRKSVGIGFLNMYGH